MSTKLSPLFQKISKNFSSKEGKENTLIFGLYIDEKGQKQLSGKAKDSKALTKLCEDILKNGSDESFKNGRLSLWKNTNALSGYNNVLLVGIGPKNQFKAQNIIDLGAKVALKLRQEKLYSADLWLESFCHSISNRDSNIPKDHAGRSLKAQIPKVEECLGFLSLGAQLALYKFTRYKFKKPGADKKQKDISLNFLSSSMQTRTGNQAIEANEKLAASVCLMRDLQNTPGGDMQPNDICEAAKKAGRSAGFKVTVFDEKRLKKEGMNGILAVGQGSSAPSRFAILEYGKKGKGPTIVLVGKGVSFDTGGNSLKPSSGMEDMKFDMSGSASVIGALHGIASLKLKAHVVGLIASAENMCGSNAIRPGDVFKSYNGKTVEVLNTDAEGRLVLADALHYAKKFNPDCVVDIATLTGAVIIALGYAATGVMGNNANAIDSFIESSESIGERCWELPLYKDYADELKSTVADIKNIGSTRGAGTAKAACFLNFFVDNAYPWVHLDVAATADTASGQGAHCQKGLGTGVPVRGLVEFVKNFKKVKK